MTTTPFSIIKEMLWREFGYTLVVTELENNGHKIVPFILNDNPNGMHARESSLSRAGLDG